jgi:hypothetical protein
MSVSNPTVGRLTVLVAIRVGGFWSGVGPAILYTKIGRSDNFFLGNEVIIDYPTK